MSHTIERVLFSGKPGISPAQMMAAAQAVMQCPDCAAFFQLIDESALQMPHFERSGGAQ